MNKTQLLFFFLFSLSTPVLVDAQDKNAEKIHWISFEEAIKLNDKTPKKFIIDVYTDWCGWCKRMDATTFSHPVVVDYINKNYWAVKLNAELKDTVKLGEQLFINENPGKRGHPHQLAIALLNGKMTYPSIVYLDENVDLLQALDGYQDAKGIEQVIKYFGENAYQTIPWIDYTKQFKSAIINP